MTPRLHPISGLTLVEVLVVLAVVGVMTGTRVVRLGPLDRDVRAETEAMGLVDRIQLASDEALVSQATSALIWEAGADRWDPAMCAWHQSEQRQVGPRHDHLAALRLLRWPPVELTIAGGGTPWAVGFDGFAAVGAPSRGRICRDRMAERSDAGFSLIEALIALAILALSAISLLAATEAHIARIAGLEARALAQFAAENRLAELELGLSDDDAPAVLLGQQFSIAEVRSPTVDPDLERIDLTVTDVGRGESFGGFYGFLATRAPE